MKSDLTKTTLANLNRVAAALRQVKKAKATSSSLYTFDFCSNDGLETFDTRSRSYSEAVAALILFCGSESEACTWIYIRPYKPNTLAL